MNNWIDPVIFSIGPLAVRWYGLMYVVGFVITGYLLKILIKRGFFKVQEEDVDTLITYTLICMFMGARFAYVFIYNWDYYSNNLIEIPAVWKGGLSFHGALIGIILGGYLFARKKKIPWIQVMDCVALAGTQGIFWGRVGNFINGELWGRVTNSSFGIVFPSGGPLPRHPSQLYEAFGEGILLTLIFWFLLKRVKLYGQISGAFLLGYGGVRFIVEFFRQPDAQLGYYFGVFTMGQLLCSIMIFSSFYLWYFYSKKVRLEI